MPRVLPRLRALTPDVRLKLMWLASPALPVGGFSYSEAMEAAVEAGLVQGEASAQAWLVDQLHLGLARSDLAVLARAVPAWQTGQAQRVAELNDWVLQTRETSELKLQAEQMGRSLLEWLRNQPEHAHDARLATCGLLKGAPTWPLSFALALALILPAPTSAEESRAHVVEALGSFAFGWAENMVGAAIKAVPLGQNAGQRILAALVAQIPEVIQQAMALSDSQRQAFTPMLAILSAQHETQYSRLFRS